MPFHPWMFGVWGFLLIVFIAFKIYVARMSRNEDDQIVLQDSFDHVREEQAAIMTRLSKAKPVGNAILALLAAMTLYVVGYYALDMINQFK